VVVAGLIGLLSLGNSIDQLGADFGNNLKTRSVQRFQIINTSGQSQVGIQLNSSIRVDPQNLIVPIRSENMTGFVQTVGANGATDFLASTLNVYTQQLLTKAEITPEQAGILTRLANEGHRLARAQEVMDGISTPYPSSFEFEGNLYSTEDILGNLTWHDYEPHAGSKFQQEIEIVLITNPKTRDPLAQKFRDLYRQALDSGALNDPAVKTRISYLAVEIADLIVAGKRLQTGLAI
jgi:hypothetical protein